ncbi:BamA/OMP85 family outer membrane protein [Fodinibius salsisoli]|uniref:BamA/TamA family outer membrane protein n=1 Tax=Fodinibius salsisoli TaxID=2820877 RepID=A0ABT3PMT5_9BACT|nr:BamA/TamA family outer membrane protein [Fodinibius salsisoli]MCW9707098.1 BamA/TamA family outer membrane protein [Fodinibius salsisoli]
MPEEKASQVWNLDIEGNEAFSDIIIKDQIATDAFSFWEKLKFWDRSGHELDQLEVKKDVIRIQNYYSRRGFPKVKVRYRIEEGNKSWKKKVVFVVREQQPIRIASIEFSFQEKKYQDSVLEDHRFQRTEARSEYQPKGIYETIKRGEVVSSYVQTLQNMGFAYAEVSVNARVDTARFSADLTIDLDLGPLTYLNDVSVGGDSTISDGYVVRESGLRKGNQYSLDAIQEAQREIFNHHLFRFATINIPKQEQDSTLDLSIQVHENKLRTIEASAGFGTDEYLRGQVGWTHRNVLGKGHQFTSTLKASYIEQTINLDYLLPYVFNTKSSFVISPFAQHLLEESYELSRMGITNSLIYRYSRNVTGSLSYQFTRNTELSQQQDESLPDTTQNYNLSSIQLSGYYNQGFGRRSQQGWVVQPYAEISGFLGTSTFQFQKLSLDIRRYTPLTSTTTLATRLQGGKVFAAQEDSLPNNIRYYVGGTNSVRGWSRYQLGPKRIVTDSIDTGNGEADSTFFSRYIPTGGRTFVAFNVEVRQDIDPLINNFGLTAFLDGGQVWRKHPDIDSRPLQFSVGGGVRYESPIGPVRLDVGYKINPSDADLNRYRGRSHGNAWDRIGIHVSIGQAF